ncbi:class I SAM-dependent methyltransferase [Thalassoroseus pseudoceratinae]|uniref:class I SAM-dependent methyltransferase n=1 Tax=Thalassoroseus pseudoceratinae TaxID=2713176 RepID=UPI0014210F53|nr:class I SAM-dependent methyltransferase [Thalassoroseus pseudoceratinae]
MIQAVCNLNDVKNSASNDAACANLPAAPAHHCRFCRHPLTQSVVDLGMSPLCETFLTADQLNAAESFYPLHAFVCDKCLLVQVEAYVSGEEIFGQEYAYFSSYSDSWLKHATAYTDMIVPRLGLTRDSLVVELASNDGYLLRNFVERHIPCLGIEPAPNVAAVAEERGIPTRVEYFGVEVARQFAKEGIRPDLLLGNNVLAHVPDINDFVGGMKIILSERGTITMEFPHLVNIIEQNHFDGFYQEHYSYLSFHVVRKIFAHHGLALYDVEELPSHGGSIRIYARHTEDSTKPISPAVERMLQYEDERGFTDLKTYTSYSQRVEKTKHDLLDLLIRLKREGKQIAGYGAPGKGNTLLNYCGIREDFLDYVVDRNPYKHGRFLPGSHIPIFDIDRIEQTRPDYIFILPWNLRAEITSQLDYTREWGAKFIVAIPELEVF